MSEEESGPGSGASDWACPAAYPDGADGYAPECADRTVDCCAMMKDYDCQLFAFNTTAIPVLVAMQLLIQYSIVSGARRLKQIGVWSLNAKLLTIRDKVKAVWGAFTMIVGPLMAFCPESCDAKTYLYVPGMAVAALAIGVRTVAQYFSEDGRTKHKCLTWAIFYLAAMFGSVGSLYLSVFKAFKIDECDQGFAGILGGSTVALLHAANDVEGAAFGLVCCRAAYAAIGTAFKVEGAAHKVNKWTDSAKLEALQESSVSGAEDTPYTALPPSPGQGGGGHGGDCADGGGLGGAAHAPGGVYPPPVAAPAPVSVGGYHLPPGAGPDTAVPGGMPGPSPYVAGAAPSEPGGPAGSTAGAGAGMGGAAGVFPPAPNYPPPHAMATVAAPVAHELWLQFWEVDGLKKSGTNRVISMQYRGVTYATPATPDGGGSACNFGGAGFALQTDTGGVSMDKAYITLKAGADGSKKLLVVQLELRVFATPDGSPVDTSVAGGSGGRLRVRGQLRPGAMV